MGLIGLFFLTVLYLLPMVGSWFQIISMMIKEPPTKRDQWVIWLLFFLSFIPGINIGAFILLTYLKHN